MSEQPISEEHLQQLLEEKLQSLIGDTAAALRFFAPHVPRDSAEQLAVATSREQLEGIPTIFQSMLSPDAIAKHPTLVLTLKDQKNNGAVLKAPKRFERTTDVTVAAQTAVLLALLYSPQARALLRAFGFTYAFAQSTENPRGSIILNG